MEDFPAFEPALAAVVDGMEGAPPELLAAIRYTLLDGGKRLRPRLLLATAKACGAREEIALPWACAVEMLHTYSLIHDDLPALDNDAMRRGKPANHCQFGEAMALLAGDALLTEAWDLLVAKAGSRGPRAVREMVQYAGVRGMVGGQAAEFAQPHPRSLAEIEQRYEQKTGALFILSVRLGALCAAIAPASLAALTCYAQALGLAFQIQDDLADRHEEMTSEVTYVAVAGVQAARLRVSTLYEQALVALQGLEDVDARGLVQLLRLSQAGA